MKVSRDTPIAELTFRKYEKPQTLSDRELVKKLCLTLGLLQPGDSRDIIVDVLHTVLKAKKSRKTLTCTEIEQKVIASRKKHKLPMTGIASSNIRRQIKRLKELFIVEKTRNSYSITEFLTITEIYESKIERFLLQSILQRAREYFAKADEVF